MRIAEVIARAVHGPATTPWRHGAQWTAAVGGLHFRCEDEARAHCENGYEDQAKGGLEELLHLNLLIEAVGRFDSRFRASPDFRTGALLRPIL